MTFFRPVAVMLIVAALAAGDAPPTPATAAEVKPNAAAPEGQELTLATAIALAMKYNETPAIAIARLRKAEAGLDRANAALRPQVTLSGSLNTATIDELPHGGKANETASWSAGATLGILKASAWSNSAAAKYALRAQRLESRELNRTLAFTVSNVFLTVLAAEQQVVAAQRRLEVSHASVADAKARLQAGMSIRTDVTRAELTEAQSQLALTQAKRGVIASRESLANLIVLPFQGTLTSPVETVVPSRTPRVLQDLAVRSREDLRALKYRELSANQTTRAAYARYVPDLTASALLSRSDSNSPASRSTNDQTVFTLALTASWSLYDGGDREGAIDEARASRNEINLNHVAQLRALVRDTVTALADLTTAEDTLLQAEARDRLARANAEEVRARYKQGLATALEDADAISSQFDAESGLVAARLDLERSRLAIRSLVGYWPQGERTIEQQP